MMKKVFVAVAFLLFISVKGIFAQGDVTPQFQASKIYRLPQGEVVNEDLFIAAERVEISGLVNGDVYAAGGQIFIDGQVNGDLLAAGGTINVSGIVMQNLRIVGGQVTLSGRTGRNTSIAGGNIEIIQSAELNRGLAAVFGNFTLNAPVAGYVKAAGGNMTLNNTVNGNVDAAIGVLRVAGKGQVQGDLNYWSGDRASIDDTALITGSVNFNRVSGPPVKTAEVKNKLFAAARVSSLILTYFTGLIFLGLFPIFLKTTVTNLQEKPLMSFIWGIISPFLIFVLIIIFTLTIIGIPLAIFILLLYLLFFYIARIPVIFYFGKIFIGRLSADPKPVWVLTAGLLIYWILIMIPLFGPLFSFIVPVIGFGATLLAAGFSRKPHVQETSRGRSKKR